uniref:Uncharacterized protein n=1 Tax=Setaria italica TaxID=4555 RepID=K3ZG56_SETIT
MDGWPNDRGREPVSPWTDSTTWLACRPVLPSVATPLTTPHLRPCHVGWERFARFAQAVSTVSSFRLHEQKFVLGIWKSQSFLHLNPIQGE